MQINWLHDKPFTRTFNVCDQHIDALGHTNNNVYSQWCEEVAWKHSASLGLDACDYQRLDRAMAIQKAEYHYQLPSFIGESLVIGTWLTGFQRKLTMERSFQVFNQNSGDLVFQGQWQLVCIKLSNHKPAKMPPEFIDTYSPHVVNPPCDPD
jgi:acyl-CoA thioester hydrolase